MKFKSNHYREEWKIKDISKETGTFGFVSLNTYSEVLEEETEIAATIINDIDIDKQIATFNIIANANKMFELLEECHEEFMKINNDDMKNKIEKLMVSITNNEIFENETNE